MDFHVVTRSVNAVGLAHQRTLSFDRCPLTPEHTLVQPRCLRRRTYAHRAAEFLLIHRTLLNI